jgi:hypothetical protein
MALNRVQVMEVVLGLPASGTQDAEPESLLPEDLLFAINNQDWHLVTGLQISAVPEGTEQDQEAQNDSNFLGQNIRQHIGYMQHMAQS